MCNKVKILLNLLIVCAMSVAQAQNVETARTPLGCTTEASHGSLVLRCHSLSLTADSLAKDAPTIFYVIQLHTEQLPPVPTTLKVVTLGKYHGYRLLPNGEHFPKGATLRLAYDPAKIPAGHTFRDLRHYHSRSLGLLR